jgi:hypothetical protein
VPFLPLDPGSGIEKNPQLTSQIIFQEFSNNYLFWLKMLKFFVADLDSGIRYLFLTLDPRSGARDGKKSGSGIRKKHPELYI